MDSQFSKEYDALDSLSKSQVSREQFRTSMQSYLLEAEQKSVDIFKQLAVQAQEKIHEVSSQKMGVLCLSESHDDLLMWAHYADCHKGFVIEFDSDSPFFDQRRSEEDNLRSLQPVLYRQARPAISLANTDISEIFLTKSEHWSYEKEWRMIVGLADADKVISNEGENICLFEFPPAAIKSVFMGARMPSDVAAALIENIKSDCSLRMLNLFKAKVHSTNYDLVFEAVEIDKVTGL